MIKINEQNELFKLLGTKLDKKIECIAIGGSAMMFYGAKTETKDVDLAFLDKTHFEPVKKALHEIGFNEKKRIETVFGHYEIASNKPVMMEGKDARFDLFLNEVIGFYISPGVIKRIKEVHEFGNLIVKIASPEDIILMKCATEREKDRNDAASLIEQFRVDWGIIIQESISQTKLGGDVVPVFLFDFLYELREDFKSDIPPEVIKKVRKIGEEIMIDKLRRVK